jgi:hypothetical protein
MKSHEETGPQKRGPASNASVTTTDTQQSRRRRSDRGPTHLFPINLMWHLCPARHQARRFLRAVS